MTKIEDLMNEGEFELMIHLDYEDLMKQLPFMYGNCYLDSFAVQLDPPFTACSKTVDEDYGIVSKPDGMCMRIYPRSMTDRRVTESKQLIEILIMNGNEVVLKKAMKGYKIIRDMTEIEKYPVLRIVEEWDLDDGAC